MTLKQEMMAFLHLHVFDPILATPHAPRQVRHKAQYTMMRLAPLSADQVRHYFWSAIAGTEQSIAFAAELKRYGFVRFEDVLEEFRVRFPAPRRRGR
jgi:hypothetical protein